jgi:hypothetical protein
MLACSRRDIANTSSNEWYGETNQHAIKHEEKYHNERRHPHKEPTWFAEDHPPSIPSK